MKSEAFPGGKYAKRLPDPQSSGYLSAENFGTMKAFYEYDAFGNVLIKTGEKEYSYQFSTKPYDLFTGIIYFNYRGYDLASGRWINRDPIEEDGGRNLYCMISNSTISNVDWLGLKAKKKCCKIKCTAADKAKGKVVRQEAINEAKDNAKSTLSYTVGVFGRIIDNIRAEGEVGVKTECVVKGESKYIEVDGKITVLYDVTDTWAEVPFTGGHVTGWKEKYTKRIEGVSVKKSQELAVQCDSE